MLILTEVCENVTASEPTEILSIIMLEVELLVLVMSTRKLLQVGDLLQPLGM